MNIVWCSSDWVGAGSVLPVDFRGAERLLVGLDFLRCKEGAFWRVELVLHCWNTKMYSNRTCNIASSWCVAPGTFSFFSTILSAIYPKRKVIIPRKEIGFIKLRVCCLEIIRPVINNAPFCSLFSCRTTSLWCWNRDNHPCPFEYFLSCQSLHLSKPPVLHSL